MSWNATQNLLDGNNLEVLKILQKSYFRKVKMIYIDPPYNTGHDFVYADKFADPLARYKEATAQTTKSNPETMGRYHNKLAEHNLSPAEAGGVGTTENRAVRKRLGG